MNTGIIHFRVYKIAIVIPMVIVYVPVFQQPQSSGNLLPCSKRFKFGSGLNFVGDEPTILKQTIG